MGLFNARWSRRSLLKSLGFVPAALAPAALTSPALGQAKAAPLTLHKLTGHEKNNLFSRIGVRPLINGRGTYTIISGSRSLPQVKQAMFEASHYYVHLDEMMDGIGARLGALTGAEWGITTTGCEAAITLATVACIAGSDVEKSLALPYTKAKDQVIIPSHSRNQYELGMKMVGVELVEVATPEELRARLSPRTAMVYIMASPRTRTGPMSTAAICAIAKEKGVPVFVDAAAEEPLKPNIHLAAGATLVGYSGGKCLRGPQSSGMMIGDKGLCKAAWFQTAPHHTYGRALKCSKEEAMGLLAAVEQWYKRDHDGEQLMWRGWLKTIEARLKPLASTSFEYLEPDDLSNRATRLRIKWDANVLKITGTELVARLDAGTPRILVEGGAGRRPDQMASSLTIMPYMMDPGEDRIIADAIHALLTNPGHFDNPPPLPTGAPAPIGGAWDVTINYPRGEATHRLTLVQNGDAITGQHKGEIFTGTVRGTVRAGTVELRSTMVNPGNNFSYAFRGVFNGERMGGTVDMGEYGPAAWSAVKA
jgi:seryl-tRNA(Sec) selenium transferase